MVDTSPAAEQDDTHDRGDRTSSERPSVASPADLVRSERLVTLGWIATSIGHDLRTPLAAIRSNASLVLGVIGRLRAAGNSIAEDVERALDAIEELEGTNLHAVERLGEIVAGLRAFAPAAPQGTLCADLGVAIDQTLRLCNQELQHLVVRLAIDEGLKPVAVPDAELMQVVMNLVLNAAQAIVGEGTVEIRATAFDDAHATLTVSDDGPGVSPEITSRLFEPGFTTRASSGGTGLGLSIVKRIVDTRGGRIEVFNQPPRGLRFVVTLPIADNE